MDVDAEVLGRLDTFFREMCPVRRGCELSTWFPGRLHFRRGCLRHAGLHEFLHQAQVRCRCLRRSGYFCPAMRWKRSKRRGNSALRYAHAGVLNRKLHLPLGFAQANGDCSFESKFEGVGEKVQNDLFPHARVYIDRLGEGGQSTTSFRPARSQAERKLLASSAVRAATSVG